ncbi:MAG: response regulator transcription factor [Actinomycetota bacterium]
MGAREGSSTKILLVDDHAGLRKALRQALELVEEWHVVGEASDGEEALGSVAALGPDVVVMDVRMPVMGGPAATRRIRALWPQVKVLAFSSSGDISSLASMLEAGACGYLLKGDPLERMVESLRLTV